jgi:hypothetical protein
MLKIEKYINPENKNSVIDIDYSLLSTICKYATYDKVSGEKTKTMYFGNNGIESDLLVLKTCSETEGENNGLYLNFTHKYIAEDGFQPLYKSTSIYLTSTEKIQRQKKRRKRVIDTMLIDSINTPAYPYIKTLFLNYKDVVSDWLEIYSTDFKDAVENESSQEIIDILAIDLGTETIKEAILKRL